MELIHIPAEILEHIFAFLDGQSFCRIKLVCKHWYETGKRMQVRNSLWKQFCVKEVPEHILEDILSFKSVLLTDKIIDWCAIYKKWFHGKMIGTSPYWKKLIKGFCYNPVTCVKISGSFVITGHSNGCLCIWNQYNGELCQKILCHLKTITDMALVDLLNLGSYYGSEELPWAHHHIITVSKDYYIQVKSLLEPITSSNSNEMLNFHSDVLCGVRVYGNQFAVSCRDNTITIWNMHLEYKPYFHLDVSLVHSIIGPRDIFFNFGFWRNEVYCVSRKGGLNVYSKDKEEWIEKKHFMISYSDECLESVVSVTAVFIFRNQIIIMLTADGKMVVSVNEQMVRHHYLMKYLHTVLVTVALNGTILALGGENGKLFLYHVPDDDHLGSLQLSNPALALQLSDASIIAIDILHDSDSPVIVAATNESIYVIKWYSIHKSHQEVKRRNVSHLFKMH